MMMSMTLIRMRIHEMRRRMMMMMMNEIMMRCRIRDVDEDA